LSEDEFDELEKQSIENLIWLNSNELLEIYRTGKYPQEMSYWLRNKLTSDGITIVKKGQKDDQVLLSPFTLNVLKKFKILSVNGFDYEEIVNRSPIIIFIWKICENWPVEFVSDNISLLGYSPEDFTEGKVSWPGITHPDDVPRLEKEVSEYLKSGVEEWSNVYRLFTGLGGYRWIEDQNKVLYDATGNPAYIQGLIYDVSERKRFQDSLVALHRFSVEFNQCNTIDDVYSLAVDAMVETLDFDRVDVLMVYGNLLKQVAAHVSLPRGLEIPLDGRGITVKEIRKKRSILVNNVEDDPDYLYVEDFDPDESKRKYKGSSSELASPIIIDNEAIGVLNVESLTFDSFSDYDRILLEMLAIHVASAITRLRQHPVGETRK
jgi:PAS domain S-box-containing protein